MKKYFFLLFTLANYFHSYSQQFTAKELLSIYTSCNTHACFDSAVIKEGHSYINDTSYGLLNNSIASYFRSEQKIDGRDYDMILIQTPNNTDKDFYYKTSNKDFFSALIIGFENEGFIEKVKSNSKNSSKKIGKVILRKSSKYPGLLLSIFYPKEKRMGKYMGVTYWYMRVPYSICITSIK